MLYSFVGQADYFFLAGAALWGLFCVHLVWTQVRKLRFKNEAAQEAFLESVLPDVAAGDFEIVVHKCEGDDRAIAVLINLAVQNRELQIGTMEDFIFDRFQYDVIAQIEGRVAWVSTIIKLAPMLGLIGTVAGMMGAFETLETATTSEPTRQLLADIRMALDHTLIGLLITVSLLVTMGVVNNRIRELEDLVHFGLNRFFPAFQQGRAARDESKRGGRQSRRANTDVP